MQQHTPHSLRVCCFGDVMGRPGRQALRYVLPQVAQSLAPDMVVVNGENAAGGRGLTVDTYHELKNMGCDVITMGNHWRDRPEVERLTQHTPEQSPALVLPGNMDNVPRVAAGLRLIEVKGRRVAVINLAGRLFMPPASSPFRALDALLGDLPDKVKIRLVDVHAEATSEKQALAHYASGRVSLLWGTHTHVPTADERILKNHTGYITDLGMVGGYDSVIGMNTQRALVRFLTDEKTSLQPAKEDLRACGLWADLDINTGKCLALSRLCYKVKMPSGVGDVAQVKCITGEVHK